MSSLMIGTWKSLDNVSEEEFRNFIKECIKNKITDFDTAFVYAKGKVEEILGEFEDKIRITTKVPGKIKPEIDVESNIYKSYPEEWVKECLNKSIERLRRKPDTLLLHNWNFSWDGNEKEFKNFLNMKQINRCKEVGISLPNNFTGTLKEPTLKNIDWIMAPLNSENDWIEKNYKILKKYNIKIICRSLFMGGKEAPNSRNQLREIIERAKFADKIVVGTTNINHVLDIKNILEV